MKAVLGWLRNNYTTDEERTEVLQQYKKTFDASPAVMEDLRRFCCIYDTTHVAGDSHSTAVNEGKRQAYMHIAHVLGLELEEVKTKPMKETTDDRDSKRNSISSET